MGMLQILQHEFEPGIEIGQNMPEKERKKKEKKKKKKKKIKEKKKERKKKKKNQRKKERTNLPHTHTTPQNNIINNNNNQSNKQKRWKRVLEIKGRTLRQELGLPKLFSCQHVISYFTSDQCLCRKITGQSTGLTHLMHPCSR